MVYVYGIIGFVSGFIGGLGILSFLLKSYSRSELVQSKRLRWTYGLMVWVLAGLGGWGGVLLYNRHLF